MALSQMEDESMSQKKHTVTSASPLCGRRARQVNKKQVERMWR
jgi:hypothetical protein